MGLVDDELCRRMDDLAMKSLELMDEILAHRILLDTILKDGFIDMAKARYSMGNRAVSVLQLPSEDADVEARRKVLTRTIVDDVLTPYTQFSVELVSHSPSEPPINSSDKNVLRKRTTEGQTKVKEEHSKAEEVFTNTNSIKTKKGKDFRHKDPLSWFGVLVPTNLKESQKSFQKAISMMCEIATMQSELCCVCDKFRKLKKQKLDTSEVKNDGETMPGKETDTEE